MGPLTLCVWSLGLRLAVWVRSFTSIPVSLAETDLLHPSLSFATWGHSYTVSPMHNCCVLDLTELLCTMGCCTPAMRRAAATCVPSIAILVCRAKHICVSISVSMSSS